MRFPLILAIAVLFPQLPAVGDPTVRQVQEELRKRKVYYGDIDGRETESLRSALKHYQEERGAEPTGEIDETTLQELGIVEAIGEEELPEGVILRSDPAPNAESECEPTPESESEYEPEPECEPEPKTKPEAEPKAKPESKPKAKPEPEAKPESEPESKPEPKIEGEENSESPEPPAPEAVKKLQVEKFLSEYLKDAESNDLGKEMNYYGAVVDYFHHGVRSGEFIRKDVNAYYKRWPFRKYEILEPVEFNSTTTGKCDVEFRILFDLSGQGRHARGRTANSFTIDSRGLRWKIIRMKERRLND